MLGELKDVAKTLGGTSLYRLNGLIRKVKKELSKNQP